ncbi:hypothetical protein [Salipiger bermudensis]|uniref:hypothetical protein n=1 Tax=Salipiger bermudensis TaxID=344736 RepID=UPI001A8F871E|nr:hypothetical protein [Salipiger bermudensis]MBN9674657.1 hypothetical protein [Salipiger bermudensis]
MPKHEFETIEGDVPVLLSLSGANVSEITVQNPTSKFVRVIATTSEETPAATAPGYELRPGEALFGEDCPKIFKGIAPTRFYGFAYGLQARVMVDHA